MTKEKQRWYVLLAKRKGFHVLGDTLTEAKDRAMFIIMYFNMIEKKHLIYRGIQKCT